MDEVKRNRFVVYTALFGDYDSLRDPLGDFPEVEFLCFTDQLTLTSKKWKIILVEPDGLSSIELNRKYKMLPHLFLSGYEMSFYVDSNILILDSAKKLFSDLILMAPKFALPKHFRRICAYSEAETVILAKKGNEKVVNDQMNAYRAEGFPEEFGLTENNLLFRRHNDSEVILCMEMWWKEFLEKSKRDQLSLMFVFWKLNFKYTTGIFSSRRSRYFALDIHKNDDTKFNRLIGYKRFKRFYDSNQPLPAFFDILDGLYRKVIESRITN
jgi:hypothetical protein